MQRKTIVYGAEEARLVNGIARHQMITKLLADIRTDLCICEIEGWDKKEYIQQLKELINSFEI